MTHPMSLSGKTVLVTGASSGIGRAAAVCCAQMGARTVITGRNRERLAATADQLTGSGHMALTWDLAGEGGLEPLFKEIVSEAGKLDGLIHCAGVPGVTPLKALSRKRLEKVMEINFYSFVELVRQFSKRRYSRDGAAVVGVSAALIRRPRPYELAYAASKAALEAAVPIMAMELKERGFRVNGVAPGAVRTEMMDRLAEELDNRDFLERGAENSILGWQTPEEIARVCAFLVSGASSAITARIIQADGGFL